VAVARDCEDNPIVRAGFRLGNEYQLIEADLPRPFEPWIDRITQMLLLGHPRREVGVHVDCAAAAR
jgi:hypothetical protein